MLDDKQMAPLALKLLGNELRGIEKAYATVNVCEWLKRLANPAPPPVPQDSAVAEATRALQQEGQGNAN